MGNVKLSDVIVTPQERIEVPGGDVLHAMKAGETGFNGFGEAYFSMIEYGFIKSWKVHLKMKMNFVVPYGKIKFVFYLPETNEFRQEIIGLDQYSRITIPPGIWCAFQGLASPYSLLLNIADIPHDPGEVERKNLEEISYDWSIES